MGGGKWDVNNPGTVREFGGALEIGRTNPGDTGTQGIEMCTACIACHNKGGQHSNVRGLRTGNNLAMML